MKSVQFLQILGEFSSPQMMTMQFHPLLLLIHAYLYALHLTPQPKLLPFNTKASTPASVHIIPHHRKISHSSPLWCYSWREVCALPWSRGWYNYMAVRSSSKASGTEPAEILIMSTSWHNLTTTWPCLLLCLSLPSLLLLIISVKEKRGQGEVMQHT